MDFKVLQFVGVNNKRVTGFCTSCAEKMLMEAYSSEIFLLTYGEITATIRAMFDTGRTSNVIQAAGKVF